MPHNFKLTGNYYVSKYGSDSNNGLTPDTPKRTIQSILSSVVTSGTSIIVIGSGVYNESLVIPSGSRNFTLSGDGVVVIDGTGSKSLSLSVSGISHTNVFNDLIIKNYQNIYMNNNDTLTFNRCLLINISPIGIGRSDSAEVNYVRVFNSSIIINSILIKSSTTSTSFNLCTLINTTVYGLISVFTNSYQSSATFLGLSSSITTTNFNYNNIQGPIIMNTASAITTGTYQDVYGRYYNLAITTSTGSGTVGDPYGRPLTSGAAFSFTNHRILYSTFNVNSISADPLFNNILKQDFTLQPNSPHLYRASNGIDNIGGTQLATRVASTSASLSGGSASVTSLNLQSSDYVVTSPATSGFVVSAALLVNATPKVLKVINYNGLLAFNKDSSGGSALNINVPDALTYTAASLQNGANPDRLTYYMRWTTGASQPTVDADWNNGGLVTAGNYSLFEWNTKPSLDFSGLGNGEQNFNIAHTPTYINATYIQLKVVLRNDYLI
jgi:hypothetical protein